MKREDFEKYIEQTYGAKSEYLWKSAPSFAVFRHQDNLKWFAVVMDIEKSKLGLSSSDIVSVVNLKCDTLLIDSLDRERGIFRGYHMNKLHWITVALDGSVSDEKIKWLVEISFDETKKRGKK